jgi:FAD synthetase
MKVLVFGTFDQLHLGHEYFLKEASHKGDLFVVIARDANVEKIKGKKPSQNEEIRKDMIKESFPSAHVVLGDMYDFFVPIEALKPDLIVLGYDQRLPPGVTEADFPCSFERLASFEPNRYKSSLRRNA